MPFDPGGVTGELSLNETFDDAHVLSFGATLGRLNPSPFFLNGRPLLGKSGVWLNVRNWVL